MNLKRGIMNCRLRAIVVCVVLLAPGSHAAAQGDAEEWVCSISNPNAADPDFVFDSNLRVVEKDLRAYWTLPPKAGRGSENVVFHYTLLENSSSGIIGSMPQDGPTTEGYGLDLLLLNKKNGSFRAGGMVIGGHYINAVGNCKRK